MSTGAEVILIYTISIILMAIGGFFVIRGLIREIRWMPMSESQEAIKRKKKVFAFFIVIWAIVFIVQIRTQQVDQLYAWLMGTAIIASSYSMLR